MPREPALKRLKGLRQRYATPYFPFAYRQDNDDTAVVLLGDPEHVLVIHDVADEGSEVRAEYPTFWHWFRSAVEDMVHFE
jgi:hypothetical protein